mmetsp:Transcript_26468/g.79786  ORF Transcript_26468/g.79786 Transcript_26468/m.79786 type:complete len:402 (-) Transcript_26468:1315-2520(-)
MQHHPPAHLVDGLRSVFEARERRVARHDLDELEDPRRVALQRREPAAQQDHKVREAVRLPAAHRVDVLRRQLERHALERKRPARRLAQQEPKVDVHDVALRIDKDVAVVPVLQAEDVRDERVRRVARDERAARSREARGAVAAVRRGEVRPQIAVALRLLQAIQRDGVGHGLDDAGGRAGRDDGVVPQPEPRPVSGEPRGAERVVARGDDLERADLLSEIVVGFDDARKEAPAGLVADGRRPANPLLLLRPGLAEARQPPRGVVLVIVVVGGVVVLFDVVVEARRVRKPLQELIQVAKDERLVAHQVVARAELGRDRKGPVLEPPQEHVGARLVRDHPAVAAQVVVVQSIAPPPSFPDRAPEPHVLRHRSGPVAFHKASLVAARRPERDPLVGAGDGARHS